MDKKISHKRIVVYTAIFGKKDYLLRPRFISPNCDYVCFTDQNFSTFPWQVRKVERPCPDATRSARKYKILAHEFFPEYEYSVWVDGNVLIKGDIEELLCENLSTANMAVLDLSVWYKESRDCIYQEVENLLYLNKLGKFQDDEEILRKQAEYYRGKGYPAHNGLAWTMVLLRRHNKQDVVSAMEDWWHELETWSKRDQMSFNYIAWKDNFRFNYLKGDPQQNKYFFRVSHRLPFRRQIYSYFLGVTKRLQKLFKTYSK